MIVVVCLTGAYSQPRISVPPGAVPIPLRPLAYRNERLVNGVGGGPNVGHVRFRRPVLAGRQQQLAPNHLDEAKPVTEEPESGETPSFFVPQTHQQQQPQQPIQPSPLPNILYRTDENGEVTDTNRALDTFTSTRFGASPSPAEERIVPTTIRTTAGAQRFGPQQKPAVSESFASNCISG